MEAAWTLVSRCNGFIETSAPWKLAKDPANDAQLDAALYHLAETLRLVAILILPVMPRGTATIFAQLQIESGRGWRNRCRVGRVGQSDTRRTLRRNAGERTHSECWFWRSAKTNFFGWHG